MFSDASTFFVPSYVFHDVAIVALFAVCFVFSSAFLFRFWSTFLGAPSPPLTSLLFRKTHSHTYKLGLGPNAPVLHSLLGSPVNITLSDGTKMIIPYGLDLAWNDKEAWIEVKLPERMILNYLEPLESSTGGTDDNGRDNSKSSCALIA